MKLKLLLPLLLVFSTFIFSQEKTKGSIADTENGKIENNVYTCYKFDWKIKVPFNYEVSSTKKVEEVEKKETQASNDETSNTTIPKQNNPHLVSFEVDKRNTFSSSFESLIGSKITSLEEHKNFMIQLFNDTYSKIETLKFELNSSNMRLGNYDFYKIQTKLYDPKTNELLLTQDLYNCFINDNLFSVNINYNNPNIGKLLTDNFISSLSK